uniref:Uncharacterized protein n=1 Tax=Cacopsylla melanoneura TaxID=428564 RepID=A0A8D8Z3E1_9HEMI
MWSGRNQVMSWKIQAISVLLVVLSNVPRNDAKPNFIPYGDKIPGDIANIVNLCPSGCEKITLHQAKPVCGGNITVSRPTPSLTLETEVVQFKAITSAKCNGATCHVELGTDQADAWYAGMDCTQKGHDATCACTIYMEAHSNQRQ